MEQEASEAVAGKTQKVGGCFWADPPTKGGVSLRCMVSVSQAVMERAETESPGKQATEKTAPELLGRGQDLGVATLSSHICPGLI